jgi:hypothetical protein
MINAATNAHTYTCMHAHTHISFPPRSTTFITTGFVQTPMHFTFSLFLSSISRSFFEFEKKNSWVSFFGVVYECYSHKRLSFAANLTSRYTYFRSSWVSFFGVVYDLTPLIKANPGVSVEPISFLSFVPFKHLTFYVFEFEKHTAGSRSSVSCTTSHH